MITAIKALVFKHWQLVGIVLALGSIYAWHRVQVAQAGKAGYQRAISDIEAAALKLNKAADEGTKTVRECFAKGEPWEWDRGAGKCVKP